MKKNSKKKKEKFVKFCPNCKSYDIQMDTTNPLQSAIGLPAKYICR